jgi:UDP-N-acetylmuramoyl-tripeptide--D-alanyl-D-alanine ligase
LAGGRKVLDFALDGPAAVTAIHQAEAEGTALRITTPAGTIELLLPLSGTHNVRNALAATTAALAIGVAPEAIRAGLEAFAPVSGRGVQFRTAAGTRVIDDTYNANPDSVRAAIDLLAQFPAPRVLVLGDMGEVGSEGPAFHREIGSYARERGVETLLALGELCVDAVSAYNEAGPGGARHCGDIAELIEAAKAAAAPEATLLAKGSRFMKMERVVQAFKEQS